MKGIHSKSITFERGAVGEGSAVIGTWRKWKQPCCHVIEWKGQPHHPTHYDSRIPCTGGKNSGWGSDWARFCFIQTAVIYSQLLCFHKTILSGNCLKEKCPTLILVSRETLVFEFVAEFQLERCGEYSFQTRYSESKALLALLLNCRRFGNGFKSSRLKSSLVLISSSCTPLFIPVENVNDWDAVSAKRASDCAQHSMATYHQRYSALFDDQNDSKECQTQILMAVGIS